MDKEIELLGKLSTLITTLTGDVDDLSDARKTQKALIAELYKAEQIGGKVEEQAIKNLVSHNKFLERHDKIIKDLAEKGYKKLKTDEIIK